jgi:hypothetical protein
MDLRLRLASGVLPGFIPDKGGNELPNQTSFTWKEMLSLSYLSAAEHAIWGK